MIVKDLVKIWTSCKRFVCSEKLYTASKIYFVLCPQFVI